VVFEIYEYKYPSPNISKHDDTQQNLFVDILVVSTDVSKSDRVVKKTQTQIGSDGLRCLIWAFLSEKIGENIILM
jgi:hypothetical protein